MKKILLAFAAVLAVSISFAAEYNIKWYRGTTFSQKEPVADDMKVQSAGQFYGMFENGEKIVVNDGVEAAVSGPNGFSKSRKISQPSVRKEGETGDNITLILQPGFCFSAQPISGQTDPGEYTAVIPAGAFTIDGTENEEFSVTFIIEDTRTFTPKADLKFELTDPAKTSVDKLTKIVFRVSSKVNDATAYTNEGVKAGVKATVTRKETDGKETVFTYGVATEPAVATYFGYKVVVDDFTELNVPGTYTVVIPEGAVQLGDCEASDVFYTNVELKFTISVGAASYTSQKPVVTPAEGELQALSGIEFEAPEGNIMPLVTTGGAVKPIVVTLPDGSTREFTPENSFNQAYFYLYNSEVFTTPGQYKVTIPKEMFKYVNDEQGEILSSGFDLNYTVTGGAGNKDIDYDLLDTSGNTFKTEITTYKLDFVYLTFKEDINATPRLKAKVEYPDKTVKTAGVSYSVANKRFMIDFGFPKQYGEYKVTFPAGAALNADKKFNNEIQFKVTFLEQQKAVINCTTSPQSGSRVSELLDIYLIAPDDVERMERVNGGITMTYFYNDEDQDNREMEYLQEVSGNAKRLKITLENPVTEQGDYTWLIPANSIRCTKTDGTQVLNTAMTFFWSIRNTGIVDTVLEEDTVFNVYTIGGVCIIRNGSREDLKSLERGMYIINGKTFIFR